MSEFGDKVDYAAGTVWRLMLWDVPENLGGLAARLGFRQTKKNPRHWWRAFISTNPGEHDKAAEIRAALLDAGIKGSWGKIDSKPRAPRQPPPSGSPKSKYAGSPAKWRQSQPAQLTARPRYGGRGHRRSSGW